MKTFNAAAFEDIRYSHDTEELRPELKMGPKILVFDQESFAAKGRKILIGDLGIDGVSIKYNADMPPAVLPMSLPGITGPTAVMVIADSEQGGILTKVHAWYRNPTEKGGCAQIPMLGKCLAKFSKHAAAMDSQGAAAAKAEPLPLFTRGGNQTVSQPPAASACWPTAPSASAQQVAWPPPAPAAVWPAAPPQVHGGGSAPIDEFADDFFG